MIQKGETTREGEVEAPYRAITDRFLTASQVGDIVGVSARTIQRWGEDGREGFPPPALSGHKSVRWHSRDISDWMDRRRQLRK